MEQEIKIIEEKINKAFDDLISQYEEENAKLLKSVADLQKQNEKLKIIIRNLIKGKYPTKKDIHLHKAND